jgi:hypothetical protein
VLQALHLGLDIVGLNVQVDAARIVYFLEREL